MLTNISFNLINRVKYQLCQSQKWQYHLCGDELCARPLISWKSFRCPWNISRARITKEGAETYVDSLEIHRIHQNICHNLETQRIHPNIFHTCHQECLTCSGTFHLFCHMSNSLIPRFDNCSLKMIYLMRKSMKYWK